ncbi:hypothetical protein C4J81_00760 [Deltaproteobacteria bacterium Smac51]|nr:hypothetical protein C4J81_00760 [Deltaproteobacteria bacterium Smac51]
MKVGIGYGDNPESAIAGREAVRMALRQADRQDPCDMALLFSTVRHDAAVLRAAVAAELGESVPIYGGGAAGVITNDYYGYAGDQVGLVCLWLEGTRCDTVIEGSLNKSEEEAGLRLGRRLAELGTTEDSPVMMFYDALDKSSGRMIMATWLLEGLRKGLGFWPDLTGAGLMGDHIGSPGRQWVGDGLDESVAIAHVFSGDIRIDSEIMHGCRPATPYYTVTRADGPVILEINGLPALQFVDQLMGSAVPPENYPFLLLFGVNHGERWGRYDEDYYASRLCLGIDRERDGIVMFEPDMVEGTQFQLMFRSLELDYIKPKIDKAFDELGGREPVLAVYIDCAGRCAGYMGMDAEDALVVQEAVGGRAPLLGLYTGVEIAPIGGRPRGLDWTGIFCLFSQSGNSSAKQEKKPSRPVWRKTSAGSGQTEAPAEALTRMNVQNMAKIIALDSGSAQIRHELELKRRGFKLLAELAGSLHHSSQDDMFVHVARRLNSALNMQRTIMLVPRGDGRFVPEVLQGYSAAEKSKLAGHPIDVPDELLVANAPVLVTGADSPHCFEDFRALIGLPYFISCPIVLHEKVFAVLITGRLIEAPPYLLRMSPNDSENVQAICALMASVLAARRLKAVEERAQVMLDATPLCANFWDRNFRNIDCNLEAVKLFNLSDKDEYLDRFYELSPEVQPCGRSSAELSMEKIKIAFDTGHCRFEWMHQMPDGEPVPCEITLVRVKYMDDYIVVGFTRDLREFKAMLREMSRAEVAEESNRTKSKFLATMSHEIRTPMNAVMGITEIQMQDPGLSPGTREAFGRIYNSANTLMRIINDILDLSKIEAGKLELVPASYEVASMISDTAGLNIMRINSKPIEFEILVDPDVPSVLIGDELRIKQILSNLLSNAFKYTAKGRVRLSVDSEAAAGSGENDVTLILRVSDTGQGMSAEQTRSLFDEYSRFNLDSNKMIEGTGLGMNITQHLVHMMAGEISVESAPGEGTAFMVRLPQKNAGRGVLGAELAENLQKFRLLQSSQIKQAPIRRRHMPEAAVLVVDDVETNLYVAKGLLSPYGLTVDTAGGGREAIDKIECGGRYDLILMDHMMPGMDGLETVAHLRSMAAACPFCGEVPIVALTANAVSGTKEMFLAHQFDDYISKPIDLARLNEVLERWIPAEKQREEASVSDEGAAAVREPQLLIRGLDTARGLRMVGGSEKLYRETVAVFFRDGTEKIVELEAALKQKDILLYTIHAHALKSAGASIGAEELSERAAALELAGKRGDLPFIQAHHRAFMEEIRTLIEQIGAALSPSGRGPEADAGRLAAVLKDLKLAIDDFDVEAINQATAALKEFGDQADSQVAVLLAHLLGGGYDDAAELVDRLLKTDTQSSTPVDGMLIVRR